MNKTELSENPLQVEVGLVITSPDGFVMVGDELPSTPLCQNSRGLDLAHEIFTEITGIDAKVWLSLRQVGFFELPDTCKTVLYAVEVPERTFLLHPLARWVNFNCHELSSTVIGFITSAWGVK